MKRLEMGRSMVEMLGVLAIVGVLSIGGIAGYSYGVDKYRANTTVNEINLRTIDLIHQGQQSQELSLLEWGPLSTGYDIQEIGWTTDNYIFMDISGLPKRVCEMTYDSFIQQKHISQIDINSTKTLTNELCSDNNLITLYLDTSSTAPNCWGNNCFNNDLNDDLSCSTDDDCPECLSCKDGSCSVWITNASCDNGAGTCHRGVCAYNTCTSDTQCADDEYCANNAGDTSSKPIPYKCKKIGLTKISITLDDGTSETWYASTNLTSWWDGISMCNRVHASLPSPDMLVKGFKETETNNKLETTDRLNKLFEKTNFDGVWSNFSYPKNITECECGAAGIGSSGITNQRFKNNRLWVICK